MRTYVVSAKRTRFHCIWLIFETDMGRWIANMYTCTTPMLDYSMQAAVVVGLSADDHAIKQETPVTCPAANCNINDHMSLAMCSRCVNVTNLIQTFRGDHNDPLTNS